MRILNYAVRNGRFVFEADPLEDGISRVELIQHAGGDKMIVLAARVSYAQDAHLDQAMTEGDSKLVRFLLRHNHGTPFEHNLITFRVKAPLYVIQEMLRHRIGTSFNQESSRYIEHGKTPDIKVEERFYIPPNFRTQDDKNKQGSKEFIVGEQNEELRQLTLDQCKRAFATYRTLIDKGAAKELARGVLPHCTYASLYFTMNLRSFFHFYGLRSAPNAQKEIRQYAHAFAVPIQELYPVTWQAARELEIIKPTSGDSMTPQ